METEIVEGRLEAYLSEYRALRDEVLLELRQRNTILYLTWVVGGAVISFALSRGESSFGSVLPLKDYALLIIPPITYFLSLWLVVTEARLTSFSVHIKTRTAPNVRLLLKDNPNESAILEWEDGEVVRAFRDLRGRERRNLNRLAFLAPPTASLILWFVESQAGYSYLTGVAGAGFPVCAYFGSGYVLTHIFAVAGVLSLAGIRRSLRKYDELRNVKQLKHFPPKITESALDERKRDA